MIKEKDCSNANRQAAGIRVQILDTLYNAGSGHYGGACSCVEIIQALLSHTKIGPRDNTDDIFILSKGHAAITYYAALNTLGLAAFDLSRYGDGDSDAALDIHPSIQSNPWVHFSTGSLGQGLSYGLGAALAIADEKRHVWVVLGDGECQEGQVWEAASLASRYALDNLHVIIDYNGHQECGWQSKYSAEPLPAAQQKWRAFGWQVDALNGQSLSELENWIRQVRQNQDCGPHVAIASTVKGAGIPYFEQYPERSHCTTLQEEHYDVARKSLMRLQVG